MAINALTELPFNNPQFDLVGPTVDDDIRRAITRYGAEAVKDAVKRQTKPKRGRRPEKDWPELHDVIKADARDWLAGGDPFATRSNYSIAKDFADKHRGQSHPATMKRIERKLVKKRVWLTLATAEQIAWDGYPYSKYISTLEALKRVDLHTVWPKILERAKSDIADYEAKKGAPPPADLTMKEVEEEARNALKTLNPPSKLGGLFGLSSQASNNSVRD